MESLFKKQQQQIKIQDNGRKKEKENCILLGRKSVGKGNQWIYSQRIWNGME